LVAELLFSCSSGLCLFEGLVSLSKVFLDRAKDSFVGPLFLFLSIGAIVPEIYLGNVGRILGGLCRSFNFKNRVDFFADRNFLERGTELKGAILPQPCALVQGFRQRCLDVPFRFYSPSRRHGRDFSSAL